jgi:hypothetical protein
MLKRITPLVFRLLFTLGLTLHPAMAAAAACPLDQATFRPRHASKDFMLRSHRSGDNRLFDLVIQRSGETFRFTVEVDENTGEGMISSVPDSNGRDPGIKITFALVDVKGLGTTPQDRVGYIAFQGLRRAFIVFRLREGQPSDRYTSPPSGLWQVAECQAN